MFSTFAIIYFIVVKTGTLHFECSANKLEVLVTAYMGVLPRS